MCPGGMYQYVKDTLEPAVSHYLLKNDNYFYLLVCCLLTHNSPVKLF